MGENKGFLHLEEMEVNYKVFYLYFESSILKVNLDCDLLHFAGKRESEGLVT